jgi:GT2 family glycosyltransferase
MNPVITALMPTKNRPDRVQRLIESIRRQEFFEGLEIIVVDDKSEPPVGIADPDVRLLRNSGHPGACAARNLGFQAARGEFIAMFDDDTELSDPTTLARAVALARANPDFGAIGFRHLQPDGIPDPFQPARSDVACETAFFFGYGVLFRRAAILQTRGFEESFVYGYEEQDLCLQLHRAGWRVMFAPELSLLHHHDPRGRNWVRIMRLISGNAIRSMMLRFPAVCVIPFAVAKWLAFFRETQRRGKIDWVGAAWIFGHAVRFIPSALRHRTPMTLATLRQYRKLRNHPRPLKNAAPCASMRQIKVAAV